MEKLLQQILSELKDLRQGQDVQGKRLERVEEGQDLLARQQVTQGQQIEKLHSDLTKLAIHVEGEITEKIRGLYDDREVVKDTLKRIEGKQDRHEERLDSHWQEIQVLRASRR